MTCLLLWELVLPGLGVVGLGFGELKYPGTYDEEESLSQDTKHREWADSKFTIEEKGFLDGDLFWKKSLVAVGCFQI